MVGIAFLFTQGLTCVNYGGGRNVIQMGRKRIKPTDKTKAVTYIRVSTGGQVESGLGLEAQATAVEAYCAMRGLETVATLRDEGVSASVPLGNRPAGAQLLELARTRKVGSVVAVRLDRMFRSTIDCLKTVEQLEKLGVSIHLVDFGGLAVDTSSPTGKMFVTMMVGFAQFEREINGERVRAAMAVKKAQGKRVGSIPYGKKLDSDKKTLIDSVKEIEVIDLIKDLEKKGISVPSIVKELNQGSTLNRGGKKWFTTQVYRILDR